jgi:hypothetical protein
VSYPHDKEQCTGKKNIVFWPTPEVYQLLFHQVFRLVLGPRQIVEQLLQSLWICQLCTDKVSYGTALKYDFAEIKHVTANNVPCTKKEVENCNQQNITNVGYPV